MDDPIRREPSTEAKAQALLSPGGYVYEIDNSFGPFTDESHIPPIAIIGAWKVDESGFIIGGYIPNENYVPPADPLLPKGVTVFLPRS